MSHAVDRRTVLRWLADNGFTELPGTATGHRYFKRDGHKVTVAAHGRSELTRKNLALLVRALERAGFDKAKTLEQLRRG